MQAVFFLIIIFILAIAYSNARAKVKKYEKNLDISNRHRIPSSRELMDAYNEKQFLMHTLFAVFPILLKGKKKIMQLGREGMELFHKSPGYYESIGISYEREKD